ncbi:hypothetical protein [Propionispira arboris]|uniref:hypothetical protein n=1 Tax=Propionispira arboris TaxID=84035 RepID=UPI000B8245FB|nr:hypothetical protein [Propionispira arboris]
MLFRIAQRLSALIVKSHLQKLTHIMKEDFRTCRWQGKKVQIMLHNRKMFCDNPECKYATFDERFIFLPANAKKTQRLKDEIINISINVSSITAATLLKNHIADIGKSTICNLLKR